MSKRNLFAVLAAVATSLPMAACNMASNGLDYSHQELIKRDPAPAPYSPPAPSASIETTPMATGAM